MDRIYYQSIHGGGKAQLFIEDVIVELGDTQDLNGKITELRDILPEIANLSGTLYLDTYDETNSKPMYTFKKNNS